MLHIRREPLRKNKLFMSFIAVTAGFIITIAGTRLFVSNDMSTQQSVDTSSGQSESSLIPVASDNSNSNDNPRETASDRQESSKWSEQSTQDTKRRSAETQDTSPSSSSKSSAALNSTQSNDNAPNQTPAQDESIDSEPTPQPTEPTQSGDESSPCLDVLGMEILCVTSNILPSLEPWHFSPDQLPITNILS